MSAQEKNANNMTISALQLSGINKSFKQGAQEVIALKNINLALSQGELAALIGPSGSGKTTLLQIAGLLDRPDSGNISINGIDASKADDKMRTAIRKNHLGFIYQFHHLLPEFSALENVALPLLIQGKKRDFAFTQAQEALAQVDLSNRLNHKPSELSGGQQQRTAIARAIVTKPSLILADEPTGNLDSANSNAVFDLLTNLTKSHAIACLLVTHNIELARKTDRIISIKDGAIAN